VLRLPQLRRQAVSGGSFTWAKEHLVILGSLSKTYSMTGWRAGYALASKPVVANLSKLQSQSTSNATSFVQKAAIAALTGSQECVSEFRAEFIDLRDYMLAKLAEIPGVTCTKPEGAFYVYPNISAYIGKGGIRRPPSWPRACSTRPTWSPCPARPSAPRAHPHLLPGDQAEHRRRRPPHGRVPDRPEIVAEMLRRISSVAQDSSKNRVAKCRSSKSCILLQIVGCAGMPAALPTFARKKVAGTVQTYLRR
jgi:hypothetical protein